MERSRKKWVGGDFKNSSFQVFEIPIAQSNWDVRLSSASKISNMVLISMV